MTTCTAGSCASTSCIAPERPPRRTSPPRRDLGRGDEAREKGELVLAGHDLVHLDVHLGARIAALLDGYAYAPFDGRPREAFRTVASRASKCSRSAAPMPSTKERSAPPSRASKSLDTST
ncbi:hypothetical protein [Polyangium mundeleinium]|uniref:Uncharacterized protein n=1 Tax=Polyangium mundeleinium TaxID=2995306 RepID=A0ABT5EMA9_9BACT|nr:hypothetical protein [Polyangium mundeleinium]MDC0742599.1 hypothetical protein [Polyangium mundeleinium]